MISRQPVAVDACVLLNLMGSGRPLTEFAIAAGFTFMVVIQAEREVLWLDPDDPDDPREAIDLEPLVLNGELQRLALRNEEMARFVELARALDDGEAATLAVAESRGLAVATDDRKARRILSTLHRPPAVTSTAAIARAWSVGRSEQEVRACLGSMERRASFLPPRNDPDGEWWRSRVG